MDNNEIIKVAFRKNLALTITQFKFQCKILNFNSSIKGLLKIGGRTSLLFTETKGGVGMRFFCLFSTGLYRPNNKEIVRFVNLCP